ncbi:hypothetical protein Tco_1098343 [Tanacetum coccineum]
MQAAQDQKKSYADRKRKLMEYEVGDRVMLKGVSQSWESGLQAGTSLRVEQSSSYFPCPLKSLERGDQTMERQADTIGYRFAMDSRLALSSPGNVKNLLKKQNTYNSSQTCNFVIQSMRS